MTFEQRHVVTNGKWSSWARLKPSGSYLGSTWVEVGVIWGWLRPSWNPLNQTLNAKQKTLNPKPYTVAGLAYKTNAFLMGLKLQLSSVKGNVRIAEMTKSLSLDTCAAKTLFIANTNANILIGAIRKCL